MTAIVVLYVFFVVSISLSSRTCKIFGGEKNENKIIVYKKNIDYGNHINSKHPKNNSRA